MAREHIPALAGLVTPTQQTPCDHLSLDLGRALEDIQDPGVAEHAGDRVFHRVTVAAVDLQRIVGLMNAATD